MCESAGGSLRELWRQLGEKSMGTKCPPTDQSWKRISLAAGFSAILASCGSLTVAERNLTLGGTLAIGAGLTPATEIKTTYYLGMIDPLDQLPPTIYRVRVRGQASILSSTKFASGWLPAEVVDSITGVLKSNADKESIGASAGDRPSQLRPGRGLVLFGPEGFREAPRNHRLVIYMGTSPEAVEQAFAQALGTVALATQGREADVLSADVFAALRLLDADMMRIADIKKAIGK